jgi:hypothetical protein
LFLRCGCPDKFILGLVAALHDVHFQVNSFRSLLRARAFDTLIFDMCGCCRDVESIYFVMTACRDGVMVEVKGSYRAAIIATCAHFGVNVSNEDIRFYPIPSPLQALERRLTNGTQRF